MLKLQNIFALSPFFKTVHVIFLFVFFGITDIGHLNPVEVTHLKFKKCKIYQVQTLDRARPALSPIFQSTLLK